jgi:CRP-like cAMP-binding protein
MDTLETIISKHAFMAGLTPRFLPLLNECAFMMRYRPGEAVFQEGGSADHFYLVQKGRVIIETQVPGQGAVTIQTLGAGDALGWSWLFPPHQWRFGARATEPTELIAFDAERLRAKAAENRDFANELVWRVAQVLLQRLQAARLQLIESYAQHAR